VTPNPPPPDAGHSDPESAFDDFINRNLDLNGLDSEGDEEADDGEEAGLGVQFHSDLQGRVFLELPGPGSLPAGRRNPRVSPPDTFALQALHTPYEHDSRWTQMVIRRRHAKLRIYQPRVGFTHYNGYTTLTLPTRASRLIRVIPEIRPGWTAVRYFAGCETPAELIDSTGLEKMHQLQVGYQTITGYVRSKEMPATRPARRWAQIIRAIDFGAVLLVAALLVIGLLLLSERLPLGEGPAIVEMQHRIDALQEQVATLEAQRVAGDR